MEDCIFCKIAKKEDSADIVHEEDQFVVFRDINPKAPVHLLLIPRKHISSVMELGEEDRGMVGDLVYLAKKIAENQGLQGYKLLFNVGREGGQVVDHLHLHLLGYKG